MKRHRAMVRNRATAPGPTNGPARPFWRFVDKADEGTELFIYSDIGYSWWDDEGVTAASFAKALGDVKGNLTVRLNSPGGDVFDGLAIANLLREHSASGKGTVTGKVDGLAASIASVIAMACDKLVMGAHSQLMIHDASAGGYGNATDLREVADLLDMISDNIAQVYADRAGGDPKDWRKVMKGEKWYTAAEAVEAGLADEMVDAKRTKCEDGREPCPECDGAGCDECDGTGMVEALVRHRVNAWLAEFGRTGAIKDTVRVPSQISPPVIETSGSDTGGDSIPDAATHQDAAEPGATWPGLAAFTSAVRRVTTPPKLDTDLLRAAVDLIVSAPPTPAAPAPRDLGPALPERAPEESPVKPLGLGDLIRGAVTIVANDQPEPTLPAPPAPELPPLPPISLNIADLRRALKEGTF